MRRSDKILLLTVLGLLLMAKGWLPFRDYSWCGFFPWSKRHGWGGEAHFEVPIAFLLKWVAIVICSLVVKLLAKPKNAA